MRLHHGNFTVDKARFEQARALLKDRGLSFSKWLRGEIEVLIEDPDAVAYRYPTDNPVPDKEAVLELQF